MAKKLYIGTNGLSREVKEIYVPVNGLSKKVTKAYCSVGGLSKQFWGIAQQRKQWLKEPNIPYSFYNGSAVVFQNKIHLLGGESSQTSHYTFDGTTWTQLSNLPFNFYEGSAIAFGGKIHCIGGASNQAQYYTYDGTTWTHETDLPDVWLGTYNHVYLYILGLNHAVESNSNLVLAGSNNGSNQNWTRVATLDNGSWNVNWSALSNGSTYYSSVAYNNLIYLIGDSGTGGTNYTTWNGTTQSTTYSLPFKFTNGYALEYDGEIHILGGSGAANKHYSFDGTTFTACDDVPYNSFVKCPAVVFQNRLHIFGASGGSIQHWSYGAPAKALYWQGNLCTDLTGGWECVGVKTWSGSTDAMMVAPTAVYEDTTVKITQVVGNSWTGHDGVWKTKNRIDLTGYTKISILTRGEVKQSGAAGQYNGTHGVIDLILNDSTTGNIIYNGDVDQGHRLYTVENVAGASKTWDWEVKTYNLNAAALAKGEEYIMLGFYTCWGRAYAEVSAVWLS